MDGKQVNVVVIGDKNAGKTSIISSLYKFQYREYQYRSLNWSSYPISLYGSMNFHNDYAVDIINYTEQTYKEYNYKGYEYNEKLRVDFSNTNDFVKYLYHIRVFSTEFTLNIWDTPGNTSDDKLDEFIMKSDVVIVAIDTPSIMENHNFQTEVEKKADKYARMLLSCVQASDAHKLVIFVPTKCEKYYDDGRLSEVANRIDKLYHSFFAWYQSIECEQMHREKITAKKTAIISPILTIGDLVFDHYANLSIYESACYILKNFCMGFYPQFAEKIFIGIANFLIGQNLCKTEILEEYSQGEFGEAALTLIGKIAASMFGVRTPTVRVNPDHLLKKGEYKEIDAKTLIDVDFNNGYREYYH